MVAATDIPFDASKHAYRTDTAGLQVVDENFAARYETAAKEFEDALNKFASTDKEARQAYIDQQPYMPETIAFGDWVQRSYPSWIEAEGVLRYKGQNLTQYAYMTFGPDAYEKKIKDQRTQQLISPALKAGYTPQVY
ncbi:uncharacterized protein BO95DRAFT_441432 [Aspergillus brunneoviolaceus CBS 621.78]|uniref:Uncharacterized protein n=1 Tax=Aspergillus brunneoviolaceus CBS 621.78 TaxID=1450534 RepID=A0ACD1GDV4_9EURO|nr:hypothetical protein BO95DRAFT_441432 [Aspergillus brunneoviolaceus CBS 621.78]RAH47299.1 hypothetical protein BO95DRAFT_441432 [Aspergillus brunneoviolaceus CBS 621.78]